MVIDLKESDVVFADYQEDEEEVGSQDGGGDKAADMEEQGLHAEVHIKTDPGMCTTSSPFRKKILCVRL